MRPVFLRVGFIASTMGRKALGTNLENSMVRKAFKHGGWGFRAPGSGTFTSRDDIMPREGLQAECTIHLSVRHVDLGYKTEYITSDYTAYMPEWGEVRVVEAKTVRIRKKKKKKGIKPKETTMYRLYYLTEPVKKKKSKYHGMMKKSNFCMELERTWMLARVMEESGVFTVPVKPYLQVRFISAYSEAFLHIPDIVSSDVRGNDKDVLKVIKNEDGDVSFEWQSRLR